MTTTMITWLIWDAGTGRLLLEVSHVPYPTIQIKTIVAVLAWHKLWPVNLDEDVNIVSLASEQIRTSTSISAPGVVLEQLVDAHRRIEWRDIWKQVEQ